MELVNIDWSNVLPMFGIDKKFLKKRHGPCPKCGGKDRFRFENRHNCGTWFCSHCGKGHGVELLRLFTDQPFKTIYRTLEEKAGITFSELKPLFDHKGEQNVLFELTPEEIAKNRIKLREVYSASVRISPTDPVWRYLHYRVPGLEINKLSLDLRYLRSHAYYEMDDNDQGVYLGSFPVMLARVENREGTAVTLHRTYLTKEGKKAPFEKVKKLMSGIEKLNGAAMRLNKTGLRILGICEGIETGASVLVRERYQLDMWALVSCWNMAIADIPLDEYDEIHIYADHDKMDVKHRYRPGIHCAKLLRKKILSEAKARGLKRLVKIHIPPKEDTDWNDVWVEEAKLLNLL